VRDLRRDVMEVQRRYETDYALGNLSGDGDEIGVRQWWQVGQAIQTAVETLQHALISHRVERATVDALTQGLAGLQNTVVAPENLFRSVQLFVCSLISRWTNIPANNDKCKCFCPKLAREFCVNELCTVLHCTAD